jgi:hypothetical protein
MRQLLSARGVPLIRFRAYFSFGYHIDKITRQPRESEVGREIRSAIDRWMQFGLDKEILEEVCLQLFSIDVHKTVVL